MVPVRVSQVKTGRFRPLFLLAIRLALLGLTARAMIGPVAMGADNPSTRRVEAAFSAARAAFETNREAVLPGWQFARACFDWAEIQERDADRARIAEAGIAACRQILLQSPSTPQAHYYQGLCQGQLARTRKLGALKLVAQMESSLLSARTLDERQDFAGPDRSLGMLYLDAPSWPTSIGSRTKARRHLESAIALEPTYPDNRLALAEALWRWREFAAAREQLLALTTAWEAARLRWTGPDWESAWIDWEHRRHLLETHLHHDPPAKR